MADGDDGTRGVVGGGAGPGEDAEPAEMSSWTAEPVEMGGGGAEADRRGLIGPAEAAEAVDALVVTSRTDETAVRETTVLTVETAVATAAVATAVEMSPRAEAPKKRGRGRPKKVRSEAEQRFVDLKVKKDDKKVAAEKENAPGSDAAFSLKSLIVAANAAKKRPALGAADANGTASSSERDSERGVSMAKPKRRRLAAVSSLRDVVGSPLENGRFLR